MAQATIVKQESGSTWFTLSNKPQFMCVMDTVDFMRLVNGTSYWYIHTSTKSPKRFSYIRCNLDGRHSHLHREVMCVGHYTQDSVIDHLNGDGLDCRRVNLNETTLVLNVLRGRPVPPKYRGFSLCHVNRKKPTPRTYWSCYKGRTFIAQGITLEDIQKRIDEYLKESDRE